MDSSIFIPLAAALAAVIASLWKTARAKRLGRNFSDQIHPTDQLSFVITRADGSQIKLEAEKANEGEFRRLVEQILRSEPDGQESGNSAVVQKQ